MLRANTTDIIGIGLIVPIVVAVLEVHDPRIASVAGIGGGTPVIVASYK